MFFLARFPVRLLRPSPRGTATGPTYLDGVLTIPDSDEVSLRRGALPGRTAFASCYSSRGSQLNSSENGGHQSTP